MKRCPVCRQTYDDLQNFCLNDGTPLVNFAAEEPRQVEPLEPATVVQTKEAETVVRPSPTTNVSSRETNYGQTAAHDAPPPILPITTPVVIERKSNIGKIVALTALATILLVAVAGATIYLALRNRNQQIAPIVNVNDNKNIAKPKIANVNSANANVAAVNANVINTNLNANLANANPNANVLPSPHPSLKPDQAIKIKKEVNDALDGWKDATDNRDLNAHMSFYGENVDYYNGGIVNAGKVRADREKAFDTYNNIEVELSNINVAPDPTGEKATVVLDKSWRFENDEKTSDGKVQQRLTMEKLSGRWYITGEKDLKIYYKNNY